MASEPTALAPATARTLSAERAIPIVGNTAVAFIGRTERGPLNEPVVVNDAAEYRRVFGGSCDFSFVPQAVQHFFMHGGNTATVVRVANRATRAVLELPAGEETLRLQARNPGSGEHLRISVDYDRVERDANRFNLVVQRLSRASSPRVEDQELYPAVSIARGDSGYVGDAFADSALVRLSGPVPLRRPEATRPVHPGEPIPYVGLSTPGTDGDELTDYDVVGSNVERTGLFALDGCEKLDLLCIPSPPGHDLGTTSFVAATRYCERRRALLVWDPPWAWNSVHGAVLWARSSGQSSQSAVTYFPRVRPRFEANRYPQGLPACGVVAGILARADTGGVWHRLPLTDGGLKASLAPLADLNAKQVALLNRVGCNALVRSQAGGAALQGNVSFAGPNATCALWHRLDTRRLALFIVRSLELHTRWALTATEADTPLVLERQVWVFLSRLHRQGALAGRTSEQAFFVRANAPGAGVRPAPLALRVGFALQRPGELVAYELRYGERDVTTRALPIVDTGVSLEQRG